MDCNPPSSSVHGILQARILEWVAIFFSMGSSQPGDWTHISGISCIGRWVLYQEHHLGSPVTFCTYCQLIWWRDWDWECVCVCVCVCVWESVCTGERQLRIVPSGANRIDCQITFHSFRSHCVSCIWLPHFLCRELHLRWCSLLWEGSMVGQKEHWLWIQKPGLKFHSQTI